MHVSSKRCLKSILAICLLTAPLSACVTGQVGLSPALKESLKLAPPPLKAIDALETTAKADAATASWVVLLEKHYEKLDLL